MFGLDARIALAIFAALSVITGATLYKTIQDVKVTAFFTEMTEVGKAWEQIYLDTGTQEITAADLVEDYTNITGWKGPYFKGFRSTAAGYGSTFVTYKNDIAKQAKDLSPKTIRYSLYTMKNDNSKSYGLSSCSDPIDICSIWLTTTTSGNKMNLAKKLDMLIDKTENNYKEGKFRFIFYGDYSVTYLKIAPAKNPN